jgi:hypothetical protein
MVSTTMVGMPDADELGIPFDLEHPHHHRAEAEQRADREVDVPGDDDQHHAAGHDPDRRGLDRDVPQVPGRQEAPLPFTITP